jgi:predicted ATP-dependent serine protease
MSTQNKRSFLYEDVKVFNTPTLKTNKKCFDDWFSADGGIVFGSAIYVSGTSGAGKTTLMVNLMKWLAPNKTSMYLREMEGRNVKYQTRNIKMPKGSAYFSDAITCPTFEDYMEELEVLKPIVVIVDSLQVIAKEDYAIQSKMTEDEANYHIIKTLREWCSKNNAILFLIGHNTKDGNFAGRNTLIQMMDAHIVMEHDKKEESRKIYWGQKNRKGPMGMLYYVFGKDEIEFKTEEEWNLKSSQINYLDVIVKQTEKFVNSLDKKSPKVKTFLKEWKKLMKEANKIENDVEYISSLTKLTLSLQQEILS